MRLRAPAKINLGLRILGVRDDGYHTIESLFAPIEVWDDLEVEVAEGPAAISLRIEEAPPDRSAGDVSGRLPAALALGDDGSDNLVVRAARAFCKHTGFEGRIQLVLKKGIPAGAGLGGGSSDAAATLLGLRDLVDAAVSDEALHEIALGLGADVPFFLAPSPALVEGIGERIEPLEGLPALDIVLANPGISLATAEVYRATDALRGALTEPRPGSTMRAFSKLCGETGNLAPALGDLLVNDLEPAAKRLCPPVARLLSRLRDLTESGDAGGEGSKGARGAIGASMSGSGATVFGVFESGDQAARAAEALRASESDETWIRATRIITSG